MAAPPDDLGLRLVACPARHLPPVPRRDSQMIFAPPGPLYCSAEAPTTTWTASCRSIDRGPRPPARRRARMVGTTYADRWETQADLGVQVELHETAQCAEPFGIGRQACSENGYATPKGDLASLFPPAGIQLSA